jgi:hypothetical protein
MIDFIPFTDFPPFADFDETLGLADGLLLGEAEGGFEGLEDGDFDGETLGSQRLEVGESFT